MPAISRSTTSPFHQKSCWPSRKKANTLVKLAEYGGWHLHPLSIADILANFFRANPYREIWLEQEQYFDGQTIAGLFEDIGASIRNQRVIERAILAKMEAISATSKSLLLITDLECLHPYSRFGPIEQQIYADISVPLLVLYPGQLAGSSLDFLSIYPPDGSYRSKHL